MRSASCRGRARTAGRARLFEFFRHDALDTINYFSKALGRPKPPLEQHDFGGVFGGPVMLPWLYNGRNKTFFFSSYEGYRNKTAAAPVISTIPTAEMYSGDFSQWRDANGNLIPIYDPATTRVNPNGPGFIRDPFPGNQIPLARFSQISRNVLQLATMRPDQPGVRNNFVYTPGDAINTNPWNKFSLKLDHNLSDKDRLGFLFHWGEVLVVPPSGGPSGGLPVPLNNFRDEDSHTYVFRANWDRVITPSLLNRVTFGHNNWWQLRASFNRDQGWGTHIGLKNVPGPELLFPLIDFSQRLSRLGPIGVGRLRQLPLGRHRRPDVGQGDTHLEDRVHLPGGPLRRLRLAHGGRHLQLQPRCDGRVPGQRQPRFDRCQRQCLRLVPARRGAVLRDHHQPLRVGSLALLLGLRAGRLAPEQQAHRSTTACATSTRRRPSRGTSLTATRTSTRTCRIRRRRTAGRLGVRRHGTGPHREADDVRRLAVGVQPARWVPSTRWTTRPLSG